uniref:VWFA domain-containing protein n=1 Tax=Panagrolaimus sp. JU765 TaxID=591449 RepID=A0AC34QNM6_9BILA
MSNVLHCSLIVLIAQVFLVSANFELSQENTCPTYCADIWNDCAIFTDMCHDPKRGPVIRAKCPCTCQVCGPPPTTIPPPVNTKCLPVNLFFVLDTSQSIDGSFYNSTVRAFVKKIALGFPMKGEINGPSSKIGVVQFASYAKVSYPLIERTRQEFLDTIDAGIYYTDQGTTNITLGLFATISEFQRQGIAPFDNVMVILMTDGISTFDIRQTKPVADSVRAYTDFFSGVGIDGINGNDIAANSTNLITLIGNRDLAFADIPHAEKDSDGIWRETRKIYPCPVPACKGVIFIGEMTEVIDYDRKGIFLNATKQIAAYLNSNPGSSTTANQLKFSIATYGNGTIRPVMLQTFTAFNRDLDSLVNDVAANNQPNAGQTYTSSILDNLYNVVTTSQLANYLVLFMGETERILDIHLTEANVKKVADTKAEIFVLDMTNKFWTNDYLFKDLVKNDPSRIFNYTNQDAGNLVSLYTTGKFAQLWNSMGCTSSQLICQQLQEKYDCPANCVDLWGECQAYAQFCQDPKKGSSIDGGFYNSTVRAFVKKIALGYPMKGEITEPSSRIGVVQFASDATVTYPLIERTRNELLTTIDGGVYYADQGITNISLGLIKALEEFNTQGIAAHDNVMVILVTDGVSTFDIRQTKPAADRVRAYTNFFAGVGIDGINGNDISANLTNLITLIGNQDLAFADIKHAEDPSSGIWSESRKIYPCPTY